MSGRMNMAGLILSNMAFSSRRGDELCRCREGEGELGGTLIACLVGERCELLCGRLIAVTN